MSSIMQVYPKSFIPNMTNMTKIWIIFSFSDLNDFISFLRICLFSAERSTLKLIHWCWPYPCAEAFCLLIWVQMPQPEYWNCASTFFVIKLVLWTPNLNPFFLFVFAASDSLQYDSYDFMNYNIATYYLYYIEYLQDLNHKCWLIYPFWQKWWEVKS